MNLNNYHRREIWLASQLLTIAQDIIESTIESAGQSQEESQELSRLALRVGGLAKLLLDQIRLTSSG